MNEKDYEKILKDYVTNEVEQNVNVIYHDLIGEILEEI